MHSRSQEAPLTISTPSPVRVRVALHQLGELCTAYDDLVTDLEPGRRRLPLSPTSTGSHMGA